MLPLHPNCAGTADRNRTKGKVGVRRMKTWLTSLMDDPKGLGIKYDQFSIRSSLPLNEVKHLFRTKLKSRNDPALYFRQAGWLSLCLIFMM